MSDPGEQNKKAQANNESDIDVKVVDVEDGVQMGEDNPAPSKEKIELNFAGSEMLRAKFPKPFEVLESLATDWVNDGKFEGLELGHPTAEYFAAKGLRKAKEVEKKVLESPVTEKVAMQAFTVGMKATAIIQEVRSKIKNK